MEHVMIIVEMRKGYGTFSRALSDRLRMARVGFHVRAELRGFLKI
jgi:hypothetical protein